MKELEQKENRANSLSESILAREIEINELEFQRQILERSLEKYKQCNDNVERANGLAKTHLQNLIEVITTRYQEVYKIAKELQDEEIEKQCESILTQIQKVKNEAKSF